MPKIPQCNGCDCPERGHDFSWRPAAAAAWAVARLSGLGAVVCLLVCVAACARRYDSPVLNLTAPLVGPEARTVLIIGDSITLFSSGLGLDGVLGGPYTVTTRAVINYDFVQWTTRLDEAMSGVQSPAQVVIPLGTNDAFNYDGTTVLPLFQEFHRQLRLRTAARTIYFKMPRTRQTSIQARVLAIGDTVKSNLPDNSAFVDLDAPFVAAGDPALLYPDIDPLHPNTRGIDIIARTIQPVIIAP